MGLWDKLVNELVDIIEWTDDSRDTMVWRFPRYQNEIKYGAKLVVRESQQAGFINEGKLADVFVPGTYSLVTQNMPILATLKGWKYGFNSPFKAEVYFVNTRMFTDRKWGTKNPIMMRDAEFGPVRLRAFGTYVVRIQDPVLFLREIVGTDGHFTTDEIADQIRNQIVSRFAGVLGTSGIPVLDLAASYERLGEFLTARIAPEIAGFGLELVQMLVENVSLPPEVEQALDRRTAMGVVGDLSRYAQFQAAEAMRKAAENPGAAGSGIGMMVGMGLGQQAAGPWGAPAAPAQPPPVPPQAATWHVVEGGKAAGPLDLEALRARIAAGSLGRDSLVWREGMAEWVPAGEVEALRPLLAAVPPPVPGAG
jgi:membrane protease subunit (stomatin/prohibitin family)